MNLTKALDTAMFIKNKNKSENAIKDKISKIGGFKISFLKKLGLFIPGLDMFILKKEEKKFIKYCSSNNIVVKYGDIFDIKLNILFSVLMTGSLLLMPFFSIFSVVMFFVSYAFSICLGVITLDMLNGLKHKTRQVILESYNTNASDSVLSSSDFNMLTKCLDKQYFSEWMVKGNLKISYSLLDSIIQDLQHKHNIEKAGDIWESTIKDKEIIKL